MYDNKRKEANGIFASISYIRGGHFCERYIKTFSVNNMGKSIRHMNTVKITSTNQNISPLIYSVYFSLHFNRKLTTV